MYVIGIYGTEIFISLSYENEIKEIKWPRRRAWALNSVGGQVSSRILKDIISGISCFFYDLEQEEQVRERVWIGRESSCISKRKGWTSPRVFPDRPTTKKKQFWFHFLLGKIRKRIYIYRERDTPLFAGRCGLIRHGSRNRYPRKFKRERRKRRMSSSDGPVWWWTTFAHRLASIYRVPHTKHLWEEQRIGFGRKWDDWKVTRQAGETMCGGKEAKVTRNLIFSFLLWLSLMSFFLLLSEPRPVRSAFL